MDYEVMGGSYSRLPVESLQRLIHGNLTAVGGIEYDEDELRFARLIKETLEPDPPLGTEEVVQPFEWQQGYASSDNGDVSWMTPMGSFVTATWVPGTAAHSWQAVAADGMSIGVKGMMVAAKAIAFSAMDLFSDQALLSSIRAEFQERRGADFIYAPLLGDRSPPLDYRRN